MDTKNGLIKTDTLKAMGDIYGVAAELARMRITRVLL